MDNDYEQALDVMAFHALAGTDLADDFGQEDGAAIRNLVSTRLFDMNKDTPAKAWWNAEAMHPAIGRALKIDISQMGGVFALAPFRLWHDGERHVILAAHPTPRILGPVDPDWLDIETVISWNPVTDTAAILDDHSANELVGAFRDDEVGSIYASPLKFFQQWAIERAGFYVRWCDARQGEWAHGVDERDLAPGKLAIGKIDKIQWAGIPPSIQCHGIDEKNLNRLILRQAKLPRAFSKHERLAA